MMVETMVLWLLVGGVLFVIFLVLLAIWVRRLKRRAAEEVRWRFEGVDLLGATEAANFFGLESKGVGQIRGNGVLVLTGEELYFRLLLPARSISIPVREIVKVESVRSHMGKSVFQPLLKVTFHHENGPLDSVAWVVPDLDRWLAMLQNLAES